MRSPRLLLALATLALPIVAWSEIRVGSSLEWLADCCPASGIYTITRISVVNERTRHFELSLQLQRPLRGEPASTITTDYHVGIPGVRGRYTSRSEVVTGDEFLICFGTDRGGKPNVVQSINLDYPMVGCNHLAVSCDLRVLDRKEEILAVFEGRLRSHPGLTRQHSPEDEPGDRLDLEWNTDLHDILYAGSACYLLVPHDLLDMASTHNRGRPLIIGEESPDDPPAPPAVVPTAPPEGDRPEPRATDENARYPWTQMLCALIAVALAALLYFIRSARRRRSAIRTKSDPPEGTPPL